MKTFLLILTLFLSLSTAHAKDVVVAISPHYSQHASQNMLTDLATLHSELSLGDTLTFLNGSDGSLIASVSIPNQAAYQDRVPKLRHGAKAFAKLNVFIEAMTQGKRTVGAMDTPLVLNQIARNYPSATDIVLIGSALYDNPQQSGADMTSMYIPSDGFISAKPTDSPFGTQGRAKQLQGKRIHWLLPQASHDSLHSEALLRFYHLYLHNMSASLVSFTHNHNAVMQLLHGNAQAMPMIDELNASDKMYMQSVRKLVPDQSLYEQPVSETPPTEQALDTKQNLTIGVEWEGNVDLDIYAKPHGKEALYFANNVTAFGKHYKDILSGQSKTDNKQYETTELDNVELSTLAIGLNVYSVREELAFVKGTVRLQLDGKTYAKAFRFDNPSGNNGQDIDAVLAGGDDTVFSKGFTVDDIINTESASL